MVEPINASALFLGPPRPAFTVLLGMVGHTICSSDLLPRVEGIIIVDLPTGFNHEQKNSNANPDYHCQHDKKYFHDVAPRMIYATIDCTDDGERTAFHIARLPKLLRRGTNAETLTG